MRYGLILLIGLLFSASSSAVDSTGKVYDIYTHQFATTVFFRIEGAKLADCTTSNRYAIDTSNAGGELLFSVLLSAQASGKEVFVKGTDKCDIHTGTETLAWIKTE
ncbi:hypothetical protein [Sessilibacter corallicola]|uniref:hypothetical protein n=1 Tax=Sessilibacter corallicola TaxID=2904075 RepID=UPI001E5F1F99|nr:hypothetical protein [Sessilibacter corallicola]MCE2030476.1 hypothetical protein [Sessilibacter corallicola]